MVAVVEKHDIKWLSPSPIWDKFGDLSSIESRKLFARPTILRFNKDDFMDEFLSVMSYYPDRLIEWKARPETWREPMPTPNTAAQLSSVEPRSTFSKRQKRQLEFYAREKPEFDATRLAQDDQGLAMAEAGLLKLYQPRNNVIT